MATSALQSSEGRQNFQRLTRLLIAGATTIGREIFDAIHPPATLATVLADPARQAILRGAKMTRPQWTQVYPSPGTYGKSEDWGLTLLHKMLRNICGLTQPATGWDDLPPDSDICKEADLVRLKYYRNSIYGHVDERMQIEDEHFQKLWKNISEAIIRLAGHLSSAKKKEWEDAIKDFLTAPLTSDHLLNIEELKTRYEQDVELTEKFKKLEKDVRELIGQISPPKQRGLDPTIDTCTKPHHEDQLVEWFCEACREFVCQTCVTLQHTTHPCVNMNDPAHMQTVRQELLDSSEKVRSEIQKHKNQIQEIEKNSALRSDKLKKLKCEIKETVNKLIEQLREQEENLHSELESTHKIYQENDDSQMSDIAEHVRKMETWLKYTEKLAKDGSAVNKVTNKEQTLRSKEELIARDRKIEPKAIVGCLFTPNENLFREIKDIGMVTLWSCVTEGEGLNKALVNVRSAFTIKIVPVSCTQDQTIYSPTTLNVRISSSQGSVDPCIKRYDDRTYIVSYVPTHAGDHNISVTVDGHEVPGCPYIVKVNRCVMKGEGLTKGVVGLRSQFMISILGPDGEIVNDPTMKLNVEIQSPQGALIPTNQNKKDGTYIVSFFPVQPGEHQVFVFVRNELSESEYQEKGNSNGQDVSGSPFTVSVIPREFRAVLSFEREGNLTGQFSTPSTVTVNNKNEIIVTDYNNHRVQVFSGRGEHLRTIGKDGTGTIEFNRHCGVVSDENNNIIVVEKSRRVHVFTETGELIRSFGFKGSGNGQLVDPAGLSLDIDGNIIVSDIGDGQVKVFSIDGICLKCFDCGGGFYHCVAHGDRYYVSSVSDHCIKVFDKRGTFLCEYGARGFSSGKFRCPSGLAVDKAGNLIVCDTSSNRVQALQMDGTFVGSFGVRGKGLGQFCLPNSVAVMEDGKIVVCDTYNNRIQVFE